MADLTKIMQGIVEHLRKLPRESNQPLGVILRYEGKGTGAADVVGNRTIPLPYDFDGYPDMQRAQKMLEAGMPGTRVSLYHKAADAAAQTPEDFANFPLPRSQEPTSFPGTPREFDVKALGLPSRKAVRLKLGEYDLGSENEVDYKGLTNDVHYLMHHHKMNIHDAADLATDPAEDWMTGVRSGQHDPHEILRSLREDQ